MISQIFFDFQNLYIGVRDLVVQLCQILEPGVSFWYLFQYSH